MEKGANAIQGAFERAKDQPDLDLSAQECEDMFVDQWGDTWSDSAADTDLVIGRPVGDIHK